MKKTFREYHQYSENEFKKLWNECIFVFDTNTLLNMYRYRRDTVDKYFEVLSELKIKNKLWIPNQVGFEFYENRITVISNYEKSYDAILDILKTTKDSIDKDYKNHPFLDWEELKGNIDKGLESVIKDISKKKQSHPKLLDKDDILEKINNLFNSCVGECFDDKKLIEIKKDGEIRYSKKIPPGFKDAKKDDDKKYGDLILWKQIIEKAKVTKKPIIFISGDVKEDWWLEKDGKRIMPLPQLKKEIYDEAEVDFHIYTADRFLEYYQQEYPKQSIDKIFIDEVRKIRELEEKKMTRARKELSEYELHRRNLFVHGRFEENRHLYMEIEMQLNELIHLCMEHKYFDELRHLFHRYSRFIERLHIKERDEEFHDEINYYLKKIKHLLLKTIEIEKNNDYFHQSLSIINKIDKVLRFRD
ncbi:PIN-like domain-containing protein [Arcobacter caeni]|uniref:PIN like domain-containing protein n=1 Tax=Arcobacter caeni TaxID=1912877 RepID=A0A363CYN3_9BACT|nr:PIN-like domain-containing protein [Arcobacter caeni]PUE64151.1 hypothetical protein B0174_07070 [Arcobacter caeni]